MTETKTNITEETVKNQNTENNNESNDNKKEDKKKTMIEKLRLWFTKAQFLFLWLLSITSLYFVIDKLTPTEEERLNKIKANLNEVRTSIVEKANDELLDIDTELEMHKRKVFELESKKNVITTCIWYNQENHDTFKEPKTCNSFEKIEVESVIINNTNNQKEEKVEDEKPLSFINKVEAKEDVKIKETVKVEKVKKEPLKPEELFYTTAKKDRCVITQWEDWHKHKKRWQMIAIDVWCPSWKALVYAPSYKSWKQEFKITRWKDKYLWNYAELSWTQDWSDFKYLLAHLKTEYEDWSTIRTWEVLWEMDLSWVTTWYHTHIELWKDWINVSQFDNSERLKAQREKLNELKKKIIKK